MDMWKFLAVALVGFCMNVHEVPASQSDKKTIQETFAGGAVAELVSAVTDGNYTEADKLINAGANINAIGKDGVSPLIWIMGTTLDVLKIEYMLKNGANPNYRDEKSKVSAMYLAAGGNRPDILELLLKNKGNPNLFGPRGETLLMIAAGQLRDKNIKLLLKYGADINLNDDLKETVANKMVGYGRFDWVANFLDRGLTYNLQRLARDVEIVSVPRGSEQMHWKEKVIEMLKSRGVKFPAFKPCYPSGDPRRNEEYCKAAVVIP